MIFESFCWGLSPAPASSFQSPGDKFGIHDGIKRWHRAAGLALVPSLSTCPYSTVVTGLSMVPSMQSHTDGMAPRRTAVLGELGP